MTRPLVSVVVLSYDRPDLLRRALESVAAQSHPSIETIVIDNKSPQSDAVRAVVHAWPAVRFCPQASNLGFAGGMNAGIAQAAGEYVYLTEDDVVLEGGCVEALVAYLEGRPDVGLAAPVMYNLGAGTIRSAGGRFELGPVFSLAINAQHAADTGQFREPFEVTYVPGASIMAHTSLLRELKGFRDDYFLYQEDLELCIRVLKADLRIAVVPAARVDHVEPPPGTPHAHVDFLRYRNLYMTYLLHAPAAVLPEFVARYGPLEIARGLVRHPGQAWLMTKAWAAVAARLPSLIAARDGRPLP